MASIYLDYAAATPLDERVGTAMLPFLSEEFYNPSAVYLAAKKVHRELEAARASVAGILGARSPEVIFTAGGTEANNLAIHGVMRAWPGKRVVAAAIEHESVLAAAHIYDCVEAPVHADGALDISALERLITDDTVLVSVGYANSEVGTIQPMREIAALLAEKRQSRSGLPLYFHSDAAQAANNLDLHASRLGVDLLSLNGGKIYGPKQSGVLWVRSGIELKPLIYGGGQERGLRSGTENVAGAVGFSTALTIAQAMREEESRRQRLLQQRFIALLTEKIPSAVVNGSRKKRLPSNIHITLPGTDNERILMALDEAGIMAAAGSACSASDEEPSHVLRAMGITPLDAQSSLRFTMGRATTDAAILETVNTLARLLA